MITAKSRKPSMGRRKIEMKLIEDEDARHVCFSKRRQGIFKKANELSILCGAEVAIVVYSPAGKPYSFGHPSISVIADRLLSGGGGGGGSTSSPHHLPSPQLPPPGNADLQALNGRIRDMAATVEAGKKKRRELEETVAMAMSAAPEGQLWDAKVEELGQQQLWRMMAMLEGLQGEARGRANQSLIMADQVLCERMISNLGFPMMENVIGSPHTGSCLGLGFF